MHGTKPPKSLSRQPRSSAIPMAPPPPPPPPFCLPFGSSKRRPLSPSRTFSEKTYSTRMYGEDGRLRQRSPDRSQYTRSSEGSFTRSDLSRSNSFSPTATITSKEGLEFKTDTESYNVPSPAARPVSPPPKQPKKKGWGYGWGLGKQREKENNERDAEKEKNGGGFWGGKGKLSRKKSLPTPPIIPDIPETETDYAGPDETESFTGRTMSMSHVSTTRSARPMRPPLSPIPSESPRSSREEPPLAPTRSNTQRSGGSGRTGQSGRTGGSGRSGGSSRTAGSGGSTSYSASASPRSLQQQIMERSSNQSRSTPPRRPQLSPTDSQSTLVGSALDRKINDLEEPQERVDTTERISELRAFMAKDNLDY